jgi:hypothetical protein
MIVQDEQYREVFESAAEQHANGGAAVDSVTATQRAPSITVVHFGAPTVEDLSRHDDPRFDLTFKIGDYFHSQRVRAYFIHTRFFPCCRVSCCAVLCCGGRLSAILSPSGATSNPFLRSTFRAPRHRCKPFLRAPVVIWKNLSKQRRRKVEKHIYFYSRALTTKHVPMMCARMRPAHKLTCRQCRLPKMKKSSLLYLWVEVGTRQESSTPPVRQAGGTGSTTAPTTTVASLESHRKPLREELRLLGKYLCPHG